MIGETFINLAFAIIGFSKNAVNFLTEKIDLTKLYSILNLINIDTSNLPTNINIISLIGGFTGIMFLTITFIKLIK